MSSSSYKVSAPIAVSDMARAEAFYERQLGLLGGDDQSDVSPYDDRSGLSLTAELVLPKLRRVDAGAAVAVISLVTLLHVAGRYMKRVVSRHEVLFPSPLAGG